MRAPHWVRLVLAVLAVLFGWGALSVYRQTSGLLPVLAAVVLLLLGAVCAYGAFRGKVPKQMWVLPLA